MVDVKSAITIDERKSVYLSAGGAVPSTAQPADAPAAFAQSANYEKMYGLGCSTDRQEAADFSWAMPDNWDAGTIYMKVYWTATAGTLTGSPTVIFLCQARCFADGETLDGAMPSAISITDAPLGLNYLHKSAESAALTPSGTRAAGNFIVFRVIRDTPTDTFDNTVQILGIKVYYRSTRNSE